MASPRPRRALMAGAAAASLVALIALVAFLARQPAPLAAPVDDGRAADAAAAPRPSAEARAAGRDDVDDAPEDRERADSGAARAAPRAAPTLRDANDALARLYARCAPQLHPDIPPEVVSALEANFARTAPELDMVLRSYESVPGVHIDPRLFAWCEELVESAPCDVAEAVEARCTDVFRGIGPEGAPCRFPQECASGACDDGRCAPVPECVRNADCGAGRACDPSGRCQPAGRGDPCPVTLGGIDEPALERFCGDGSGCACVAHDPQQGGIQCRCGEVRRTGSVCAPGDFCEAGPVHCIEGRCVDELPPVGEGAPCGFLRASRCGPGLRCGTAGACERAPLRPAGAPCSWDGDDECAAGLECNDDGRCAAPCCPPGSAGACVQSDDGVARCEPYRVVEFGDACDDARLCRGELSGQSECIGGVCVAAEPWCTYDDDDDDCLLPRLGEPCARDIDDDTGEVEWLCGGELECQLGFCVPAQ